MIFQILFNVNFIIFTIIITQSDAKRPVKIYQHADAVPGEFPYMASIRRNNVHICGGAIISSRHILTAAHCFSNQQNIKGIVVITGAIKIHAVSEIYKVHNVKQITLHSEFTPNKLWRNDIAIVTLSDIIIFDEFQNSIALPNADAPGNFVASLSGWGNASHKGEKSDCLKETKVAVLTNEECRERYMRLLETQMCGLNGKGTGFCNGDSGSPLVYKNEVIGIVSVSVSCESRYLDNYTRVFKYMNFISKIIATT